MKALFPHSLGLLAGTWLLAAGPALAQEGGDGQAGFIPPRPPQPAQYKVLWENSPFTVKPPPPAAAPTTSFAEGLVLSGVMDWGGKMLVILQREGTEEYIELLEGEERAGIRILSVENPQDPFRTRVEIASGGEKAEVAFDLAQMVVKPGPGAAKQAAATKAPAKRPPQAKQPAKPKTPPKPPPTVTPRRRIILPK